MTFSRVTYWIGGLYEIVCSRHRNQMTARLSLLQETLIRLTLSWFGHSYVSECSIHWTGYSLRDRYQWVSAQIVSTCHLSKSSSIEIYFRRVSVEVEEKKGYVKSIMILTCVVWDWHAVQNVSAILCWITMKIWPYGILPVCMWHSWWKLGKCDNLFSKGKLVRL